MERVEIERIHAEYWRPGWGSVTPDELEFFQDRIAEHRPESFIEIGTASGLSGGMICRLLDENGGKRFVTVDYDNTFFGDPTQENGFQLPLVYPGGNVEVVRRPFTVSIDVPGSGETFDMGFVDANHQHPWPLIDTLCLYPVMTGPKLLFQHDLDLYRKQDVARGIGPKYLYDQFPDQYRDRSTANNGNLFTVSLDIPQSEMERIAIDAFALPWTLVSKIAPRRLPQLKQVLRDHYSPEVLEAFVEARKKYNFPTARGYKRPDPEKRAARQAARAAAQNG